MRDNGKVSKSATDEKHKLPSRHLLQGEYVGRYAQAILQELSHFSFETTQSERNSHKVVCL
jgi:hypothetical protein